MSENDQTTSQAPPRLRPSKPPEVVLAAGTQTSGELKAEGDVRVDGTFEGRIEVVGWVIVGEQARVTADVIARHVQVDGQVHGSIQAVGQVQVGATGQVWGQVDAAQVFVDQGGQVHPPDAEPPLQPPLPSMLEPATPPVEVIPPVRRPAHEHLRRAEEQARQHTLRRWALSLGAIAAGVLIVCGVLVLAGLLSNTPPGEATPVSKATAGSEVAPTRTAAPTRQPTSTSSPTSTSTPRPTPTATPVPSATSTAPPTHTPTVPATSAPTATAAPATPTATITPTTPTATIVPATPTATITPTTPTATIVSATPTATIVPATPTATIVPVTPTASPTSTLPAHPFVPDGPVVSEYPNCAPSVVWLRGEVRNATPEQLQYVQVQARHPDGRVLTEPVQPNGSYEIRLYTQGPCPVTLVDSRDGTVLSPTVNVEYADTCNGSAFTLHWKRAEPE